MKTFDERIREISDEALRFIAENVKEPIELYTENEDKDKLYVTAFDFVGEPYETIVKRIYHDGIYDCDETPISLGGLSCQSVARIADYVMWHLKKED